VNDNLRAKFEMEPLNR